MCWNVALRSRCGMSMRGWRRKHVCNLAGVCKKFGEDPSLTQITQNRFAETYRFIKQFASVPNAGGAHNVTAVISRVCGACKTTLDHECAGRDNWQQPCLLMQNIACRQGAAE